MKYTDIDYKELMVNYENWWKGELKRPLIAVTLSDGDHFSRGELLSFVYNHDMSPVEVAGMYAKHYSHQDFLGDAFPNFYVRTTGLLGVFMGQRYELAPRDGTVWYHSFDKEPDQIDFTVDKNNSMYKRTFELIKVFQDHFKGSVVLGGANLGGVCDVYHSVRGMENAIYDLMDEPEFVMKSFHRILDQWLETNNDILKLIDPEVNHGYTHWTSILSKVPYDMIQADLAFLVGEDDYEQFIEPVILQEASAFERNFFHLDGPGFIKHLPRMLSYDKFDGIQWIPGAGAENVGDWPELYEQINKSGKKLQVFIENADQIELIDKVASCFNDVSRICFICSGKTGDQEKFSNVLRKYDVIR